MDIAKTLQVEPGAPGSLLPLSNRLLAWYDKNRREMPWRGSDRSRPDPYHVWVSEIMLQQTRVEAVRGYFSRFVDTLPDIPALAAAPEETLLKLWEGLGYYSRARNLQKAAKILVADYGGRLPADFNALQKLPGIGVYTAGAIASMAFGLPHPAPDGNVYRVLTRLLGSPACVGDTPVKTALAQIAGNMLPPGRPGDFNQALMDLGATVCLPNGAPLCPECPWEQSCAARRQGTWEQIPNLPQKRPRKQEPRTILLLVAKDRLLLTLRPPKGLLAGMPQPVNLEGHLTQSKIRAYVEEAGGHPLSLTALGSAKHLFTHVEWQMLGYLVHSPPFPAPDGFFWADREALLLRHSIPSAFKAYMSKWL